MDSGGVVAVWLLYNAEWCVSVPFDRLFVKRTQFRELGFWLDRSTIKSDI